MTLKDYLKELNRLVELHPESLEYEVIYSSDDEGNEYAKVNYLPSRMSIDNIEDDRFLELSEDKNNYNAVIVN